MKKFMKQFHYGEKGFTLIELLVVIAILGVVAAVAVPNVGKFIGRGKAEAYATELHNVQTSTMAMMVDSSTALLDDTDPAVNAVPASATATTDMADIKTTDTTPKVLTDYMTGLGDDPATTAVTETTCVRTGCSYQFGTDGKVLQTIPSP